MHRCIVIFLLLASLLSFGCGPRKYGVQYQPGSIQILGTSNELCFFVEIDRMVYTGKSYYDTPGYFSVGHMQELITLAEDGKTFRKQVAGPSNNVDGVSFNPNLSDIFRKSGEFYLAVGPSRDHQATVFRWNGKGFARLDMKQNLAFLEEYSLSVSSNYYANVGAQTSALTESDNWKHLGSTVTMYTDFEFSWNGKKGKVSPREKGGDFELVIEVEGLAPVNLDYSANWKIISHEDFKKLPDADYGYPKD